MVGSETSGVLRDRTYNGYDFTELGQAVEDLAGVIGGFDFSIETSIAANVPTSSFKLWYPQRGRNTGLTWEIGVHCDTSPWQVDGTIQATQMDALGAGDGDAMLVATAVDTNRSYPLLDDTVSYKDVSDIGTLSGYAAEWLDRRHLPVTYPSLTLRPTSETQIGQFIDGDFVTLSGSDGYFDFGKASPSRIISYENTVSDEGDESIAVTFKGADAEP